MYELGPAKFEVMLHCAIGSKNDVFDVEVSSATDIVLLALPLCRMLFTL
jgi:hypothetical protein